MLRIKETKIKFKNVVFCHKIQQFKYYAWNLILFNIIMNLTYLDVQNICWIGWSWRMFVHFVWYRLIRFLDCSYPLHFLLIEALSHYLVYRGWKSSTLLPLKTCTRLHRVRYFALCDVYISYGVSFFPNIEKATIKHPCLCHWTLCEMILRKSDMICM